jgi:cytidylate kinase
MIIAIDGPAGAGKSSVTKEVARQLGFACMDTGAMYRSIAWKALEEGVSLDDAEALTALANAHQIEFAHDEGDPSPSHVYIDGTEITSDIRTARIDKSVSKVSSVPGVRAALVAQQQRMGAEGSYVVEGRDIGTVVFPKAELKIFLTASAEERARRRVAQNLERGVGSTNYEEVLADIVKRDELDSSRETSPLKPAEDAVLVDSTDAPIDQIIARICDLARSRM